MDKSGFLVIVFSKILKSCHHVVDFFDHLMKVINLLQIQFFLHFRQFLDIYLFTFLDKFLKISE